MTGESILAFDVGNTRIKAGLFQRGELRRTFSVSSTFERADRDRLSAELARATVDRTILSSVAERPAGKLLELLRKHNVPIPPRSYFWSGESVFSRFAQLGSVGLRPDKLETPQTTGADRLLATFGARMRAPNEHVVVVTAGSAITVNLATADGFFQGGAILPGLRMMADALHLRTASLPRVDLSDNGGPDPIGRSTHSAIRAGVYYAAVAGANRLVELTLKTLGSDEPRRIFLTGGDAEYLRRELPMAHEVCPHLVLEGLYHADRFANH